VSVHDTGIGIPPEDIPHLFQKFYRVDSSQTQNIGGTGLGLYLCRRLVEAMAGRLWVESLSGEGTTFFVSLARLNHEEATERIERSAEEAVPTT
jgi:signal transduction histidine kinase